MPARRTVIASMSALALSLALATGPTLAEPTVITLTQTGCQFLEPEGVDHGFETTAKADCEAENARSGDERLAGSRVMKLPPGEYVFRVTNKNVPYGLGFWLRGDGLKNRALLPSVSGGGLTTGSSKDYRIDLRAGEYVFSCPLNPTLDYRIVVTG